MKQQKQRGRPRKKKAPYTWWVGAPLLEFLNYTAGQVVGARLNAILRSEKPENIPTLRERLIADLLPLTTPARYEKADQYLQGLCSKIDSFEFPLRLSPLPADKDYFGDEPNLVLKLLNSERKLFRWGKHSWIVNPYHAGSVEYSGEKNLYLLVAAGLQGGQLSMLRRCQQCNRFFIADERRQVFCSTEHARAYWDDPERAKKRVYKSRGLKGA